MRSGKLLAKTLAAVLIFMLFSTLITLNVSAEPYKEYTIVPDNRTTIVATDFDSGVYGKAPADGSKDIRPDEDVNTEVGGSEYGGNIGWIAKGDWVQYTVNVAQDGKYRVEAWLASDTDPTGGVKLYYNDVEAGTSENSAREGWQVYNLYFVADVEMTAGTAVLKTEYTGGINIAALEITPLGENGNPIWIPAEHKIKSFGKNIIKAVDFDPGVYGKAPADGGSKDIRPDEEVNTEIGESEFGSNIGWIAAGDWVQYTVDVQRDGKYTFEVWLASDADPTGAAKVYVDDQEAGTSPLSAKNGWQAYELYPAGEINMTKGEHVIKVEFTGGVNYSALEVNRTGDIEVPETEPPAEESPETVAEEVPAEGESETAADDGGSDNTMLIILLAAIAVVVVVVVIVVIVRKRKK
jgi:hypothetical protein